MRGGDTYIVMCMDMSMLQHEPPSWPSPVQWGCCRKARRLALIMARPEMRSPCLTGNGKGTSMQHYSVRARRQAFFMKQERGLEVKHWAWAEIYLPLIYNTAIGVNAPDRTMSVHERCKARRIQFEAFAAAQQNVQVVVKVVMQSR